VEVASDDGNAEFLDSLLHALQDFGGDCIISYGEHIHHGHWPATHGGNVMDIDQNRAVAGPLRINLHEPGPDTIRSQEHDLIPVVDNRRILSKGGYDALGLYREKLHDAAYLLFAGNSRKSTQLGCQRLQIHQSQGLISGQK